MAVDETLVEMVRDELRRISDRGELATRAQMQDAGGVGAGDLDAILTLLREGGELTQVEPDGWRLLNEEEQAEQDIPDEAAADAVVKSPASTYRQLQDIGAANAEEARRQEVAAVVRVELASAVANALDVEGLGKIVAAGIAEAKARDCAFVFEVTP